MSDLGVRRGKFRVLEFMSGMHALSGPSIIAKAALSHYRGRQRCMPYIQNEHDPKRKQILVVINAVRVQAACYREMLSITPYHLIEGQQ